MLRRPIEHPERDVAGAAGDVQEPHAGPRRQPVDQRRLPQPMDARAHQVVHQVVAVGDPREQLTDQAGLVLRGHLLVAERGGEPLLGVVDGIGHRDGASEAAARLNRVAF